MNRLFAFSLVLMSLFFLSCKKVAPQLPSNKGVEIDNSSASLVKINQDLILKEDSIIEKYAKSKGLFRKSELGFWYKIVKLGNGQQVKDSVACKYSYTLSLINGKTIESNTNQIIIGKKKIVVGLEEGLKLMHKGDSATFIIPWYLGYGMNGNKPLVPAFTSLIYQIKLFE